MVVPLVKPQRSTSFPQRSRLGCGECLRGLGFRHNAMCDVTSANTEKVSISIENHYFATYSGPRTKDTKGIHAFTMYVSRRHWFAGKPGNLWPMEGYFVGHGPFGGFVYILTTAVPRRLRRLRPSQVMYMRSTEGVLRTEHVLM